MAKTARSRAAATKVGVTRRRSSAALGAACLALLAACSGKPGTPAPAASATPAAPSAPSATPAGAAATPAGVAMPALLGGDIDGLRSYLRTVQETPARRFEVEWHPDVVRVDRDAALRSLRGLSRDGAQFRFAAGDPALAGLRPGRILVLWGIAVRRVRSLAERDGELVVQTDTVSLSEVFRNANIEIDYALQPQAPLVVVPHVQAEAPPPASARLGSGREAPGILPVRYDVTEPPAPGPDAAPPAGPPPAEPSAPQAGDTVLPLGLDSWGVKGYHGFDISAKYGPAGDGIAFELQARLVQSDLSDESSAPNQGADTKAGQAVGKDFQNAEAEQRRNARQGIRDTRSRSDVQKESDRQIRSQDAARSWDKAKKAGWEQGAKDQAAHFAKLISSGSGLWDLRLGVSGKLRAASTNDTLRVGSHIVIRDSSLALMRTDFNNVKGQLALFFIVRRGEKSEQWIAAGPLKVELPIRFNIPVIVGGLPFMFQVAFNFTAQPALTTKNDSFTARYEIPFDGNGTLTYDKGKVTTGGTLHTVPQVLEALGSSIGVSAILIGVQAPRVGFGLGLFAASSVAYLDLVNTFTITSGGQLGMFPCKNHRLISTVNGGIDTQIALPLDGWAKLLDKPLGSTFEQISKAASTRQQIYRKEWTRLEPPIKACEL